MKFALTQRAAKDYDELQPTVQALVDKQLTFLLANLHHPSLRAKKYDESRGVWQGRVNRNYRFYFTIDPGIYRILTIIKHPK